MRWSFPPLSGHGASGGFHLISHGLAGDRPCQPPLGKGAKDRPALLPPSLREVASGVPRKPDDGRSTPSVIAARGADSSLWEGAVISPPVRDVEDAVPYAL